MKTEFGGRLPGSSTRQRLAARRALRSMSRRELRLKSCMCDHRRAERHGDDLIRRPTLRQGIAGGLNCRTLTQAVGCDDSRLAFTGALPCPHRRPSRRSQRGMERLRIESDRSRRMLDFSAALNRPFRLPLSSPARKRVDGKRQVDPQDLIIWSRSQRKQAAVVVKMVQIGSIIEETCGVRSP